MFIESFDEYKAYYEKYKKLPLPQMTYSDKPLNERQLLTKYKDYQRKIDNNKEKLKNNKEIINTPKVSEYTKRQMKAKQQARNIDPKHEIYNAFLEKLSIEQRTYLKKNCWGVFATFDPAHIFSCGEYPFISDNVDNIVMIPRFLHTHIDQYLDPFNEGEKLTEEEHTELWKLIVGEERYNRLLEQVKSYRKKDR